MTPRWRSAIEAARGPLGWALIGAWLVLAVIGIASLGVSHTAPMPEPTPEERLTHALLGLREQPKQPFLVHVIYARCSCTERLFRHLIERRALAGMDEEILFVGEDEAKKARARQAGYRFTTVSAAELVSRFGLEAAPVLFAFTRDGRLAYAGGYFDKAAAVVALDERIVSEVQRGLPTEPLPVYGCAVSPQLQKSVDPLGIVYRN
jgi:hypothetical protein